MNTQSLGHFLRDTRQNLGLSLDDAVADLHIRRAVLESFEAGIFEIPEASEVQVRGFIRNYARFLYLNEDNIIGHYEASLVQSQKSARRRQERRYSRQQRTPSTWAERVTPGVPNIRPPKAAPMASRAQRPRPQSSGMMIMMAGMMIGAATLTGTFFLILYLLYQLFPPPPEQAPDRLLVAPGGSPTPYSSLLVLTPGPSSLQPGVPTVGVAVTLEGVRNGWIQVTIDGRALAARPIATGERVEYVANREVVVDTSDAETFTVAYNGQDMGAMGNTGEGVRLVFTREGFAVDANAQLQLVGAPPPQQALIAPVVTPPPGLDYVSRFDAPLSSRLAEIKVNRPLTVFFYDVTNSILLANVDMEKQMPVVSAVKGPILMYFFDVVDPTVWNSIPVELWNVRNINEVPDFYRAQWQQHRDILRDLYRMIVVSDNISTGNALRYAYDYYQPPGLNPIQAFNHWSMEVVGMSAESGMRQWDEGGTNNPAWIEERFNSRTTPIYNVPRYYNNTYSALDLARFYTWLYTEADRSVYQRSIDVMSVVERYPGFLEDTAFRVAGIPVSKDGYVGPGDRNNARDEYLTADAGLILVGDRAFVVVTMGVNAGDKMPDIYLEFQRAINQERNLLFWPPGVSFVGWVRGTDGPYAGRNISVEGANFVLDYLTAIGQRPEQNRDLEAMRLYFEEARTVWLSFFPNDDVPSSRTAEQSRVIAARYGGSGENLYDIALELGYVRPRAGQ